jgi:hypothetical protein
MRTDLSRSYASFWGEDANDYAGGSVAGVGDVNGDGYDDFIVGADGDDDGGSAAGQIYLILGKASGWAMDTDLSAASASFWGEDASDNAGVSVAGAGDVNGDGYDDFLVGAYADDDGGSMAGQAYLILGKASGWAMDTDLSAVSASFWGEDANDYAGGSVAGAGDVNGDGYDDFLIGAYGDDDGGSAAGQAYLILGKASGWAMDTDLSAASASFWGEDADDRAGGSVAGAGDVNGDGYDDFIVGADGDDDGGSEAGQTYLILGKASGWAMDTDLSAASASFWGEDASDYAGYSMAGAGDVNGDGYDDFLVGAYGDDDGGGMAGQAYLILGKASGWAMDTDLSAASASFWGEDGGDSAGWSVAGAGDVNGDGCDDFLVGAYYDDDGGSNAGQTYLILGKASGWAIDTDLSTASASFCGEDAGDNAGYSVASAGDVNGDGYDDILIGASGDDDGGSSAGQTYLILPFCAPPGPRNLSAGVSSDGKGVTLSWQNPGWNAPVDRCRIYRSNDGSNYAHLATIPANVSYTDNDVVPGLKYYYSVVLVYASGESSDRTSTVGITYELPAYESVLGFGKDFRLENAHATFRGEDASDFSGYSVAGAGDVNGDGYDDILIGAYGDDDGGNGAGQTYLLLGKASGWATDTDLSAASASFWGEDASDYSGRSVAGAGDVNGDGYDDILIGAYGDDDGGSGAGQTYLILGKASGWAMDTDLSIASASFWGEDANDYSGYSVAGAGDVNGDGYDDFLVGAYGDDDGGSDAGQTYLILGKASGWAMDTDLSTASASFWGEDAADYAGRSVAGAGDVNGDGYDDFLVGAYGDDDGGSLAGQTYLILGKASGWAMDTDLSAASASFWGEDAYDTAGYSVAGAGDVNEDGYDDYLVGAYGDDDGGSNAGQTYLILGKASGWAMDTDLSAASASFWGEDAGDVTGCSVAGAGDVNGDGYDDFLVGAYGDDDGGSSAGQTYLILGKASGWAMDTDLSAASASFWGEDADDASGYSVAGAGDVNVDGYDDILIGAFGDDDGGSDAGQSYLILPNSAPPGPANLQARLSPSLQQITLTWDAAASWNAPVTGYRVCRSIDGDEYVDVAFRGPSDRTYTDTNVTLGRTYYYKVLTLDGDGGMSGGSAMVSLVCDRDTDSDGIGDMADWDDDGDGVPDGQDAFPLNSTEWLDTDLDGIGNNADTDDDNDGIPDAGDPEPLNPQNALQYHIDFLNTTLQGVQATVVGTQSLLAFMNGNLTGLAGNVSLINASLSDMMTFLANDIMDMLDTIDTGITGLDSTVTSDMDDLRTRLAGMNATLRADIAIVLAGISGMNATLRADIAAATAGLAGMNATLRSDLANVLAGMAGMNSTIRADIAATMTAMAGMNATLRSDLANVLAGMAGMNSTMRADIAATMTAMAGMNATLRSDLGNVLAGMAGMNSTMRADIAATMTAMAGMNATLRSDILTVVGAMAGMNSTLQNNLSGILNEILKINTSLDLTPVLNNISGLNASLRSNITTVLGSMAGMNASLKNDIGTVMLTIAGMNSSTQTGIGNVMTVMAGMNSSLQTNIGTVLTGIAGMNSSTQTGIGNVMTVMAGMNSSLQTNIGTVLTGIAGMNSSTQTGIGNVLTRLVGMNDSLQTGIGAVMTGLTDMDSALRAQLLGMNASLAAGLTGIRALVSDVSADLASMRAYLEGMNASTASDISGLESRLEGDLAALGTALEAVNASVGAELRGMGDDISAFRAETAAALAEIMAGLERDNRTQNENYQRLQTLINNINTTSLADIRGQLAALQADGNAMEAGLIAKLDDFRDRTMTRFDNITALMAVLDDLRALNSDLDNIQTQVGELKDRQEGTSKDVEALAVPSWGSLVIAMVVLALAVVIVALSRGKKPGPQMPGTLPRAPTGTPLPSPRPSGPPAPPNEPEEEPEGLAEEEGEPADEPEEPAAGPDAPGPKGPAAVPDEEKQRA